MDTIPSYVHNLAENPVEFKHSIPNKMLWSSSCL